MRSYEFTEYNYSGDGYSGCLVGKPKIVAEETVTSELARQLLGSGDKRLGL